MRNPSTVGVSGRLRGGRLRRWCILGLAVVAAACGDAAPSPSADGGVTTATGAAAVTGRTTTGVTGPTAETGATGSTAESGPTGATAGTDGHGGQRDDVDDLKVFAYATTDEAQVAAQLAAIVDTLAELEAAAAEQDADAARAAADELEAQAETLEQGSNEAADRQRPLDPRDEALAEARAAAIEAFGSTGAVAGAAIDLVAIASDPRPGFLEDVAELADTISAEADRAAAAFERLNDLLAAWAEENPAQATRALAEYGG